MMPRRSRRMRGRLRARDSGQHRLWDPTGFGLRSEEPEDDVDMEDEDLDRERESGMPRSYCMDRGRMSGRVRSYRTRRRRSRRGRRAQPSREDCRAAEDAVYAMLCTGEFSPQLHTKYPQLEDLDPDVLEGIADDARVFIDDQIEKRV